jgi:DNA-binding MarR family transcriptional regulator
LCRERDAEGLPAWYSIPAAHSDYFLIETMHSGDKELEILQSIYHRDSVHQRDLAVIVGLSLGMTNAIVKRLAQKGFLMVRKINNRNIRYAVTPDGIDEIARRSYRYFKRTIKNVVFYKESIDTLMREAKRGGFATVVLVGQSDLDFIVEHSCHIHGLELLKRDSPESENPGEEFVVYAESVQDIPAGIGPVRNLKDMIVAV